MKAGRAGKAGKKKPATGRTDAAAALLKDEADFNVLSTELAKLPGSKEKPEPRSFNDLIKSVAARISSKPKTHLLWLLHHARFFGIAKDGSTVTKPAYFLPVGFTDWDEWEEIVCSKILVLSRLEDDQNLAADCDFSARSGAMKSLAQETFVRACMVGSHENGFDSADWQHIFDILTKNGRVQMADALNFLRRIDDRRQNFKLGRAHPLPPRQLWLAEHWIYFDPEPGTPAGLCAFTNSSAAMILNSQNGSAKMTEQNFSRDTKKLGLLRCHRASFKVKDVSGGLAVLPLI